MNENQIHTFCYKTENHFEHKIIFLNLNTLKLRKSLEEPKSVYV
jgi:hypothetical protein